MSRIWLLSLICLAVSLSLFVPTTNARFDLKVNEDTTTISFQQVAPTVLLSIENRNDKPLSGTVRVELLKPSNVAIGTTESSITVKSGRQKISIVLPLKTRDLMPSQANEILWYRLHYRVVPHGTDSPVEGYISLSLITPDLFELRVAGPGLVREGMLYKARVSAVHPMTNSEAKGVFVKASATLLDDRAKRNVVLTDSGTTNDEGYSDVEFQLPQNVPANDFELLIEGTRGGITVRVSKEIDFSAQPDILVSTDKPIYQPGQTLHARALILGGERHALSNKDVALKIKDPEDTIVFSVDLKTSRFGIASADWTIPEHTRLGTYSLQFSSGENQLNYSTVKISRYDLPNFVVNVKTDRAYYLKGQGARITVRGDYLFAEPVRRGQVRVVRDAEQNWNYREQKYETTEGEEFKGELGSDQTFTVDVPLATDFKDLANEEYSYFEDLRFTAFLTDASTNRTEQRQFNVRISKEPIHVYAMRPGNSYSESRNMPLTIYVSTFYADGTPASCHVVVTEGDPDDYEPGESPRVVGRVKTNQYGVGKLSQVRPPPADDSSDLKLNFSAQDKQRNKGTRLETFEFNDDAGLKIETSKTVFVPGEQILATIVASEPMRVSLDVLRGFSVIQSQLVEVRNRRASVVIPYRPEFKGDITLGVHSERGDDSSLVATRTIIYPHSRDLKLAVQSTSETYKPGDQARLSFKSVNAEGSSVESALGIVVVDKAVDERARTDASSGYRSVKFLDDALAVSGYGYALGTVSLKTLEKLDLSKPVPVDLDLAAEILLNRYSSYDPDVFTSDNYVKDHRQLFVPHISDQLTSLRTVLTNVYQKTLTYPQDEPSLRHLLSTNGVDLNSLRDPWGMPYRPSFTIERTTDLFILQSAGADKQFDTGDDITATRIARPYFRPTGEAMDRAVASLHQRGGGFIRDFQTLRDELISLGINLDTLKDRWGKPYTFKFEVNGSFFVINVTTTDLSDFEFTVWQSRIDYFAETRIRIDEALHRASRTRHFPESRTEMRNALLPEGIDLDNLHDPWGNPYYATFKTFSLYTDQVRMQARAGADGDVKRIELKPVTSVYSSAILRSRGPDQKEGTLDDFDVARFSITRSQQSATDPKPKPAPIASTFSGATGSISGTVTDPNGAAIPNVTVTARTPGVNQPFTTTTDENGNYLLRNLPQSTYELQVDAVGFKSLVISDVRVQQTTSVQLDVVMQVGTVAETVTITGGAVENLETSSSQVTTNSTRVGTKPVATLAATRRSKPQQPFSTPHLREYFPETLFWQPELTTDKKGRAQLEFKLADNITTWKMSVISSTEAGEIGIAEKEIKTFQPFFAELDPPQVLTQGDRISLPVVVRNYLPKKQTIDLELKSEDWFSVNSTRKQTTVDPRESATQFFDIRAMSIIAKGKQRVTAVGTDFSDAIEKSVAVHPDGEEKSMTATDLLNDSTSLPVELPSDAISNATHVELKIYPNLMSHVWESVDAILQRPYGCAEQTISSTYPSLLILRSFKATDQDTPIKSKAQRYLMAGYQKLLGYQNSDGGFTYWGRGDGDIALTAYALRFLTEASDFVEVDDRVTQHVREWLLKKQRADGSWPMISWWHNEIERQTAIVTAYVARSLAESSSCGTRNTSQSEKPAVEKALVYLERRSNEMDEPYLIASYVLAALPCDVSRATNAIERLRKLAKQTTRGTYWALETNTPFYGWGIAGRVETTALVVYALAKHRALVQPQTSDELIDRGVVFLLREKDRYGCWYSGQATINVLDALLSVMSNKTWDSNNVNDGVDVLVNGQKINSIQLPTERKTVAPILVDLSAVIKPGGNKVELKRSTHGTAASVQLVATYWTPWKSMIPVEPDGDSKSLRLDTQCDKTDARVMEQVTCRVKAQRVGFRGYGMLLAEIGLPPGADVDRTSLDKAMTGWAIDQYDVLPDRVVVYMWPRSGGSEFELKFRPRMAMNAQSAASTLYDYYNPDARATVSPSRFVVK